MPLGALRTPRPRRPHPLRRRPRTICHNTGHEQVALLGHSWGAALALEYAAAHCMRTTSSGSSMSRAHRPEYDMTLPKNSKTALRGAAASEFGRDLVERSRGGRPSIDPDAGPGEASPVRQVRLPRAIDNDLIAFAELNHRNLSEVMRAAIVEYLTAHREAS